MRTFKTWPMMLTLLTLLLAIPAIAATYDIDTSHSAVEFKIKHLAISNVKGTFDSFEGTFSYVSGQPDQWQVNATIDVASVDTGNAKRDDHLKNEDFFNVAQHPTIVFKSTGVKMDGDEGKLMGDLTMHGKTLPVTLDLELNGEITDPWGNQRVGFTATGKIDRREWDLTYGRVMEGGGLMIGNDVKLTIEIEGIQQK
ncbi:polyisoprenoid-binding protein [bacterium DOLZORAL124_64_63]|nr:MAG: polyisoprenoid-binding protein [bacterium DOLZORAL124_64_63]